jgi:tRNA dimethylallyltransferase
MLYFKSLREGLDELPQADPELRAQLDADIAHHGIQALHQRLAVVDPTTAMRLPATDTQRIQRAMEIYLLTGQPMSSLLAKAKAPQLPFNLLSIALEPSDRSVLHNRIAERFHGMLAARPSLLDEVATLRARGDLSLELPSMRCVGYRQAWEHLDGAYDRATLIEKGIAATRQLAKRQLTWLRGMPDLIRLDCLAPDLAQQLMSRLPELKAQRRS